MFLEEHLPRTSCASDGITSCLIQCVRFSRSTLVLAVARECSCGNTSNCLITAPVTNVPTGTRNAISALKNRPRTFLQEHGTRFAHEFILCTALIHCN